MLVIGASVFWYASGSSSPIRTRRSGGFLLPYSTFLQVRFTAKKFLVAEGGPVVIGLGCIELPQSSSPITLKFGPTKNTWPKEVRTSG